MELDAKISDLKPKANSSPESLIPECYVCYEELKPPRQILTCSNGHLVCSSCVSEMQQKTCGECRADIHGRATDTEKMIKKIMEMK